jgi:hypothetical protein
MAGAEEIGGVKLSSWDRYQTAMAAADSRDVSILKLYNGTVTKRRHWGISTS